MEPAPPHAEEARRLAALARLGLMDSPAEDRFDRLAWLASTIVGTPISLVSLVDAERQWFKARIGLDATETPREHAFCAHAIAADDGEPFIVNDARLDARFALNPLVTGDPHIRFYAGQVIHEPSGMPVGTLCAIDRRPRDLDETQRRALRELATLVEEELALSTHRELVVELAQSERSKTLILQSITEGLVLQDVEGRIVEWNPAAETVLGLSGDELAGRASADPRCRAVHADGSAWPGELHPAMESLRTGEAVEGQVMGVHRPDGSLVWLEVNAHPIADDDGEVTGVVAAFEDVTNERLLQAALRQSEETARASLDALEQGVLMADATGRIHQINPSAERLLGYTADELTELWRNGEWETFDEHGEVLVADDRPIVRALRTGERVLDAVVGWDRRDGERILLRLSCVPESDGRGGLVIAFTDITMEHRLMIDLARFGHLFRNANDIITVIDDRGHVLYASPSNERILGYPSGWRPANGIMDMVHPDDLDRAGQELSALIEDRRGPDPFSLRVRTFNGEWRHLECVGVNLLGEPAVNGIVITSRDTTEREALAAQLVHRASHDELTDLATRRLLHERLTESLARAVRDDRRVGLCYVDLDGFKGINDTFGHAAGDHLLMEVAERIRQVIRSGDTAARLGGDEFVVILDPVSSIDEATLVAERIRDRLVDVAAHLSDSLEFGASIGLALSCLDDTPFTLLDRADAALYRAKARRNSSLEVASG